MPPTTPATSSPAASRAQIILAPHRPASPLTRPAVFLAGTIDSSAEGAPAPPWRTQLATSVAALRVAVLDPTRPDWDASWVEDVAFAPFREQVAWELDMMDAADLVVVYLAPGSRSPVSLLELGLCVRAAGAERRGRGPKQVLVGCPEGYWKRGNVQVVCGRLGVEVLGSLEELISSVRERLVGLIEDENVDEK